jgi:hypothetical protein
MRTLARNGITPSWAQEQESAGAFSQGVEA